MANISSLQTNTLDYTSLIGNNKVFHVPRFQRDYTWDEEYWEDLWLDIRNLDEEEVHYMGYIVLQQKKGDSYEIIDGQQRMATLSIIALAVLKHLKNLIETGQELEENKERTDILRGHYLGHKDPSSLTSTSKLFLNRNNDDFYQSYLLRLRKPANLSRLKTSERLLWKAFEYFHDRIAKDYADSLNGEWLAGFLNKYLGKKLIFSVIYVDDELSAYKVFETLNARGVKLSPTDLLKNYLFSIIAINSEHDLEQADRQWAAITDTLGREDFPRFLRCYWNSHHSFTREKELFKAVKKEVKDHRDAFKLLDTLENLAGYYSALSRPEDDIWEKDQREYVQQMKLFSVKQWHSLALACINRGLPHNELSIIFKICSVISFRYNIISGLNPNVMEKVYSNAANKISSGVISSAREIFKELNQIYISDEVFKNNFITKNINTKSGRLKKIARYILFNLENQLSNSSYEIDDSSVTIEHILPENPATDWENSFQPEEQENYIYRLGNLTLLETSINKKCSNRIYIEKKEQYTNSRFRITKEFINYEEWNPTAIRKRQEKLAKAAKSIWKIDL